MAKGLKGKAICSVKGCERHVHSWSMCDKHAKRARRNGGICPHMEESNVT